MNVITNTDSSVTTTNSEAQPKLKLSTNTPAMDGPTQAPNAKVIVLKENQRLFKVNSYQDDFGKIIQISSVHNTMSFK